MRCDWNTTGNWSLISGTWALALPPTQAMLWIYCKPKPKPGHDDVPITVGEIDFGTASNITIAASGSNVLTLNNNASNAILTAGTAAANSGTDLIQAPLSVATILTATISGGTLSVNDASSTTNSIGNTSTFNMRDGGGTIGRDGDAGQGLGSQLPSTSTAALSIFPACCRSAPAR